MKISEITCSACSSSYSVAEASVAEGSPGHAECMTCGKVLAYWTEPSLRVYRLELAVESKYPRVPAPSPGQAYDRQVAAN